MWQAKGVVLQVVQRLKAFLEEGCPDRIAADRKGALMHCVWWLREQRLELSEEVMYEAIVAVCGIAVQRQNWCAFRVEASPHGIHVHIHYLSFLSNMYVCMPLPYCSARCQSGD